MTPQLHPLRTLLVATEGSALIEFALLLPLLVLLIIGTADTIFFFEQQMTLTHAAAAAAAVGSLPGNSTNTSAITNAALLASPGIQNLSANASAFWTCTPTGPHLSSSTICSDGNTAHQWLEVDLAATMPALFNVPGLPVNLPLHATVINPVPWNP